MADVNIVQGDRILVNGIEVYAYGGVTESERRVGQRYQVDVAVDFDLTSAGDSDSLADTISYAAVHDLVIREMTGAPFVLVESRAHRIADAVLNATPAEGVFVRVLKLAPPIPGVVASAGVQVYRRREV